MSYQTANYEQQGGDVWVIGGELRFVAGSKITNAGTQAAAIADLTNNTGVTPDSTVADGLTVTAITDSTTGVADGTLADVGAVFAQATLNNNFADLAAKVNLLVTDVTTNNANVSDLTAKLNLILAALRGAGIVIP